MKLLPKISFTCDVNTINATALVKPLQTGPDTKSTRKPRPNTPMSNWIIPDVNDKSTALCQTPPAACRVTNAEIAVGPIGMSLDDPSKM